MLELLTPSDPVLLQPVDGDYAITRTLSGSAALSFTLFPEDEAALSLREEAEILDTATRQTYRIRGIRSSASGVDVEARLQLDDWEASAVTHYEKAAATAISVLTDILPGGWSIYTLSAPAKTLDFSLEYGGTPLEIAQSVQETYACALEFDNHAKALILTCPQEQPISSTVLTQSADLSELPSYTGKSTNLVTRLYPVGANGLTIESVNDGKPYVECFDFTDRVIAKIWKDERYTIPEHLRDAAVEKLKTLSQPESTWEVRIFDLYRQEPQKWREHKAVLGQKLRVSFSGRMIAAMIVEETVHPGDPSRNRFVIGTVMQSASASMRQLRSQLSDPNSSFNRQRDAATRSAVEHLTGSVKILDASGNLLGQLGNMTGQDAAGSTQGVSISNGAGDCYGIVTGSGVRLQAGAHSVTVTKNGGVYVTGTLYQRGSSEEAWKVVSG